MRSFKSSENIQKKEGGSYYVVSANKASSVTFWRKSFKVYDTDSPVGEVWQLNFNTLIHFFENAYFPRL